MPNQPVCGNAPALPRRSVLTGLAAAATSVGAIPANAEVKKDPRTYEQGFKDGEGYAYGLIRAKLEALQKEEDSKKSVFLDAYEGWKKARADFDAAGEDRSKWVPAAARMDACAEEMLSRPAENLTEVAALAHLLWDHSDEASFIPGTETFKNFMKRQPGRAMVMLWQAGGNEGLPG